MQRLALVLATLLLVSLPAEAARRRSVLPPAPPAVNDGTPAAWLAANAFRLTTTDLVSDRSDLAPLRSIVGEADVVGLGDGTHGTHEFYTVKLRIIDYLVREMGFDVVAFEGSLPLFDEFDAYVQGGPGDARSLVMQADERGYVFWNSEEIIQLLEWARDYNSHRGERPAVRIAGADVWDPKPAARNVLAYLQTADPSAVDTTQKDYDCVLKLNGSIFPLGCQKPPLEAAYRRLEARRSDLGSGAGAAAFENALQNARVIVQSVMFAQRDENMATNVKWLREHRSATKRVVYWAHSEHATKSAAPEVSRVAAGTFLARDLGSDYVVIGTMTGGGEYVTWTASGATRFAVPAPQPGTYEHFLQHAAQPAALIPLRGNVPSWLSTPARYFFGSGAPVDPPYATGPLAEKFDAVVYIHTTSGLRVLH